MLFPRKKLLEVLYKDLPQKETRVLTNKKAVSIETHAGGVKVLCEDGSTEEGSIVVGCDGVHSCVRSIMQDLKIRATGSGHVGDSETPMVAQYQLLADCVERIPHMKPGTIWEVRDNKASFQIFMLEKGIDGIF